MIWCFTKKLPEMWCISAGMLSWWSCPSPVAHSWRLLNHPDSFCGGMFKLKAKFDVDLLLSSLSHFACDGHTVHTLNQQHVVTPLTSTMKSSLFKRIPVHSPWLPGYIDEVQTVPVILTMKWLDFFQIDFIHIYVCISDILLKYYYICRT